MLDSRGRVILDELCKPKYRVVDLNTRWSGISSLEEAKHDLDSIRVEMNRHVSTNTIIVGHGLENDLKALRVSNLTSFCIPE
jgi:hypothetical protein